MKNIEEMSAREIRDFLYKKELEENSKVVKTGILKENLYCFESSDREDSSAFVVYRQYLTEKMKNETIKDFKDSFKLMHKKGTKVNRRSNGCWYFGENALYGCPLAEECIEDIQDVK